MHKMKISCNDVIIKAKDIYAYVLNIINITKIQKKVSVSINIMSCKMNYI